MKKILLLLLSVLLLSGCAANNNELASQTTFILDTVAKITIYDTENKTSSDEKNELINKCFSLCQDYEKMLSTTIEGSDIWKINHSNGKPTVVSGETADLIRLAIKYSKLSDGRFDITIEPVSSLWDFKSDSPTPPDGSAISKAVNHVGYKNIHIDKNTVTLSDSKASIDLGGIAKGYIGDKAKEFLEQNGVTKSIIDFGGNILVIDNDKDNDKNEPFKIGIQKPFSKSGELIGVLKTTDDSIVTSGTYERYFKYNGKLYHHLLDTSTGWPVDNGLSAVTIIAPNSADADALSTAAFCLGKDKGMKLIESIPDTEAVFITNDGKLTYTDGIKNIGEFK
ncbi:MAG: FAD:protein FMN transferase [Clostridia bacterium]|jgi:thiamine biosynthesis lipoprotein|nr:FAD:protein FMN transferase [Clostridia bacterium]MCI2000249.1 FAD:protein FMN transferase [Clostridia bacterium]MCI2014586.1 FAD:protein FMN transferase [Clostridia bacterium]